MNEKIQAILLKLVLNLKRFKWIPGQDWELTLKSQKHIPIQKSVSVVGNIDGEEFSDQLDTHVELTLESSDQITFYPTYTLYSTIFLDGAGSHEVVHSSDIDIAFTDKDIKEDKKIEEAAKRMDRLIADQLDSEYNSYIADNDQAIKAYKYGGWKADVDED